MSSKPCTILVVEDSDEDYGVLTRLLRRLPFSCVLKRCKDGDHCLETLTASRSATPASYPALILLDLNLPGTSGREVLEQIKQSPDLRSIPITVVTTSADPVDVTYCYHQGANSYIIKQGDLDTYQRVLHHLLNYWFEAVTLPSPA